MIGVLDQNIPKSWQKRRTTRIRDLAIPPPGRTIRHLSRPQRRLGLLRGTWGAC